MGTEKAFESGIVWCIFYDKILIDYKTLKHIDEGFFRGVITIINDNK